eukprot:c17693_g1_i3.p1 GENE.c17693_g1_i3~~c17693_g1_i3.p1  ORF type:complete len:353 (-),score=77.15 c17693_g1_i3:76-1134(-)
MLPVVRVGIVGSGMSYKVFHGPLLESHNGFCVTHVVCRPRPNQEPTVFPGITVVADVAELLLHEVDLVVIATPTESHFALAQESLRAGKHVVVEKPFTTTPEEADQLIALAKEKKVVLTVFQNRRWDSDFLTLRDILSQELLGELTELSIHYDRYRPVVMPRWRETPKPGSGILFDLGSHLIDQALVLFGMPSSVTADVRMQRLNAQTDDFFDVTLHYASRPQLKVRLHSTCLARTESPRYVAHGVRGSYVKYGLDVQEEALKQGRTPMLCDGVWGDEPEAIWGEIDTSVGAVHLIGKVQSKAGDWPQFYSNVYNAITEQVPLAVSPEIARNTIAIICAAHKSAQLKQTVFL